MLLAASAFALAAPSPAQARMTATFVGNGSMDFFGNVSISGQATGVFGPATAAGTGSCIFYGREGAGGGGNLDGTCNPVTVFGSPAVNCRFGWNRVASLVLLTGLCDGLLVDGALTLTPPPDLGTVTFTAAGGFVARSASN